MLNLRPTCKEVAINLFKKSKETRNRTGYIGVGCVCFCCHVRENYCKNFATEKLPKPIQNCYCRTISLAYGITLQTVFVKILG